MFFRFWTADRVDVLRTLWMTGGTLDEIAAALTAEWGEIVSRSKISGAAYRYGLPRREVPLAFRPAVEARRLSDGRRRAKGPLVIPGAPDRPSASAGCRWIYGENVARPTYCGLPGDPWCPTHRAVVYVKIPPRVKKITGA